MDYECIIVGGGPGGMIAAVYLRRFHRRVLIVDRDDSRVKPVPAIKNLVGYAEGISGRRLLNVLKRQVRRFKADWLQGEGIVFRKKSHFEVRVNEKVFSSKYVLLATGIRDRQPRNVDFEELCRQGALAYCPICDAYDHSNQVIAVLIDSNAGFNKIKFLYNYTRHLRVVSLKELKIPARHLEKLRKFKVKFYQGVLQNLSYDDKARKLTIKLKGQKPLEVQMAYVALGSQVRTEAFGRLKKLNRTKDGFILVNAHQQTSIAGLYAVGDCVKSLAQVSVAIGQAAIAATDIHNQLSRR